METEKETEEVVIREEGKEEAASFLNDERGIGVIEIILILVVLIGLVLLFKDQITDIVNNAFGKIGSDAAQIIK